MQWGLAVVNLIADEIMRLHVKIDKPRVVGATGKGLLKVIPIVGGTFTGDDIEGTVVAGGADWNTAYDDGIVHVFAKYMLHTSDGEYIAIENEGWFDKSVDAVIKTKPSFQADRNGKYHYLNYGVYVGELAPTPGADDSVEIVIYKLR